METKRFIGNDMTRIYARVRRDFGPDAVIVRTRSLLREGAEPLIEVLAAPPEGAAGLTLELQQAMVDGVLSRVERTGRQVTVGDLEDLVERERASRRERAEAAPALTQTARPAAREGTSELPLFAVAPPSPVEDAVEPLPSRHPRSFPALPDHPAVPPPDAGWAARPRPAIITRQRRLDPQEEREPAAELSGEDRPGVSTFARHRNDDGTAPFVAAGLSERAARILTGLAPGRDPADALAALLDRREVHYPDERHTAIITIQGAAGAGRTTALMRMALDCADSGRHTVLLAGDGSHVAGRDQVHAYAEAIGLTALDAFEAGDVVRAAGQAPRGSCLFIDVPAGPWQPPAIPGVAHFAYLALPSHWQSAVLERAAREFDLPAFSGVVLTCTDLAPSLSPVVSQVVESPLGVAFLSSSRDVGTGIAIADPAALASGIFTMGTGESTDGRVAASA